MVNRETQLHEKTALLEKQLEAQQSAYEQKLAEAERKIKITDQAAALAQRQAEILAKMTM